MERIIIQVKVKIHNSTIRLKWAVNKGCLFTGWLFGTELYKFNRKLP